MRRNPARAQSLEAKILKRVRTAVDGISRVELARNLRLAPSTIGIYVDRLIDDGFLLETEKAIRETGRPPVQIVLNPEAGEFIGVDFEARNIMAVAVDFSDKPLRNAQAQIADSDSAEQVKKKIEQTVAKILPDDSKRLLAIGVGVPGLVNSAEGVAIYYKYLPQWRHVPLAQQLKKRFGVPVFLENNARSMALAELWFGQGLGVNDFLCLGIRSGIGAGVIIGGQLHCGAFHGAGEIGRWRCPIVSGKMATWFAVSGNTSPYGPELQDVASVRAIISALERAVANKEKTILAGHKGSLTFADVVGAVQQRDPLTVSIIEEAVKSLAWAIHQLSSLVEPRKVIISGPLTMLGPNLLMPLRVIVGSLTASEDVSTPEIVNSTMGEFSGALGAAALAVHEWKPNRVDPVVKKVKTKNATAVAAGD